MERQLTDAEQKILLLTPFEKQLLIFFAVHDGLLLTNEEINKYLYSNPMLARKSNCVEVFVMRIRKKLNDRECIETKRNFGYTFRSNEQTRKVTNILLKTEEGELYAEQARAIVGVYEPAIDAQVNAAIVLGDPVRNHPLHPELENTTCPNQTSEF